MQDGGHTLPEVEQQFKSVGAELSVLAFVTQFIPVDVSPYYFCKTGRGL
jgi:hypothetical protein